MSSLAFDKQGKPFAWHRRTRKLLVRLFRNPAARGTCSQVLDAMGNPLYIDAATDYLEFRKAVGNVPGLYRLDQCDDDGVEIDDAQPAYVSIDVTRNTAVSADDDVNPLVIIEHLAAIQADVMKTMAAQQAALISASAEILRAPYRPAPPTLERPKDKSDEEEEDDDEDDDDDEFDDNEPVDPWATWRPLVEMMEPHLPKLGEFLYHQFVSFLNRSATSAGAAPTTAPAVTPASSFASARTSAAPSSALSPAVRAQGATAGESAHASGGISWASDAGADNSGAPSAVSGSSMATVDASTPAASASASPSDEHATQLGQQDCLSNHDKAEVGPAPTASTIPLAVAAQGPGRPSSSENPEPTSAQVSTASTALAASSATAAPPRNALPTPTPQQMAHLFAIRTRLSDAERVIAENAIRRMTPDILLQWLAELSAMSVDDAVRTIRQMIRRIRSQATRTRR